MGSIFNLWCSKTKMRKILGRTVIGAQGRWVRSENATFLLWSPAPSFTFNISDIERVDSLTQRQCLRFLPSHPAIESRQSRNFMTNGISSEVIWEKRRCYFDRGRHSNLKNIKYFRWIFSQVWPRRHSKGRLWWERKRKRCPPIWPNGKRPPTFYAWVNSSSGLS